MTARRGWIAFGIVAALIVAGIGFVHFFEWHEEEIVLPSRGEARYNQLYALGKALRAQGFDVSSRATLHLEAMALGEDDVLLLATDPHTLAEEDAQSLLDWVHGGGHLIFALPGAASGRDAWLIAQLDLNLLDEHDSTQWQAPGAKEPSRLGSSTLIAPSEDADWTWSWPTEDGEAYFAARGIHGDGSWLALPKFYFLTGRALEDPNHVALTWALLQPVLGEGRVHLVYAVDLPPLYVLLVTRGWPVWVPALLALFAWLWGRSQRLGPMLPLPAPDRRALLEHIRAAGEFAFRRQRGAALHAALKRRFEAQLARDEPALAALEGEAQVSAIAAAWQLPLTTVRAALRPADLTHPDAFAAAMRSLSQLKSPT